MSAQRRVRALLRVWADAGVTVTRHGAHYQVHGIDAPRWWRAWCDRYATELASTLPDQDRALRRPVALPENGNVRYNVLTVGKFTDGSMPATSRLGAIDARAALAEYALLD